MRFAVGVRTIPAGSLQFVDFSKPDPGADRVQRFMTAAQHAMAEGDYPLAAKRLIFARDAEATNAAVVLPGENPPGLYTALFSTAVWPQLSGRVAPYISEN